MAYQFADGFDNYGNNYTFTNGYPWTTNTAGAGIFATTGDFRFAAPGSLPSGCASVQGGNAYLRQNLASNQATLIVGFGYKIAALPSSYQDICTLWDGTTPNPQISLILNNLGQLFFARANGGGINGTTVGPVSSSNLIVPNAWYGIQLQVTISSTVGAVSCYVNGNATPSITGSSLNTQNTANAYANQVSIGTAGSSGATGLQKYDDFFCLDNTGGFLNALLGGDARILTKMPASAGNYSNWTPNGLGSNFQNAAVQPPNTADYNSNNTATTKDSYTMQSAGLGVAPYFVMARASLERDDAGTHNPSLFVRSGATDSSGVATATLTSSYLFYDAIFQNDPATGIAWTATGADNAQAGIIEG
jgi:hypothetical protein